VNGEADFGPVDIILATSARMARSEAAGMDTASRMTARTNPTMPITSLPKQDHKILSAFQRPDEASFILLQKTRTTAAGTPTIAHAAMTMIHH